MPRPRSRPQGEASKGGQGMEGSGWKPRKAESERGARKRGDAPWPGAGYLAAGFRWLMCKLFPQLPVCARDVGWMKGGQGARERGSGTGFSQRRLGRERKDRGHVTDVENAVVGAEGALVVAGLPGHGLLLVATLLLAVCALAVGGGVRPWAQFRETAGRHSQ